MRRLLDCYAIRAGNEGLPLPPGVGVKLLLYLGADSNHRGHLCVFGADFLSVGFLNSIAF